MTQRLIVKHLQAWISAVAHYEHTLRTAEQLTAKAQTTLDNARHDEAVYMMCLLQSQKALGEHVLMLLTCGISHRKALQIIEALGC